MQEERYEEEDEYDKSGKDDDGTLLAPDLS